MKFSRRIAASAALLVMVLSISVNSFAENNFDRTSNSRSLHEEGIIVCESPDEVRALQLEDDPQMLELIAQKESMLNRRITYPSTYHLSMAWQQQINDYYCGPATASMILSCTDTPSASQSVLAGDDYLRTDSFGETPWFSGTNDMTTASPRYYNMMYGINKWQTENMQYPDWSYTVYPYNQQVATDDGYIERIKSTIYMGMPVALMIYVNGFREDYPSVGSNVKHWVVCTGWSGDKFMIYDPASEISGFENVPHHYLMESADLLENIHGIVH